MDIDGSPLPILFGATETLSIQPTTQFWGQLALFLLLLLGGAYFAGCETAFASANRIRLRARAEDGSAPARRALQILDQFDKALSTILVGNNIMHLACASLVTVFVSVSFGAQYVTLATLLTTLLVFFFSELLPKAHAKGNSEMLSMRYAPSLNALMVVFTPISAVLSAISNALTRLFGGADSPSITEEELYDMIEDFEEEGALEEERSELLQSALEFDDIFAQNVLTPRVDVAAIDVDDPPEKILAYIREERFSRYPVYENSIDSVIGILQARTFYRACIRGEIPQVRDLLTPVYTVHKRIPIDELLRDMRTKQVHMALVCDDYGGTMGIVTVEDILEELVGEIWDEDDEVVEDFQPIGGGRVEAAAGVMVEDAFARMDLEFEDDLSRYESLGAWALAHFDAIPAQGDSFCEGGLKVTVHTVDGQRITKLLLQAAETEVSA